MLHVYKNFKLSNELLIIIMVFSKKEDMEKNKYQDLIGDCDEVRKRFALEGNRSRHRDRRSDPSEELVLDDGSRANKFGLGSRHRNPWFLEHCYNFGFVFVITTYFIIRFCNLIFPFKGFQVAHNESFKLH